MGAWIMSIVGVICLGVLLEIVLPDGKMTKYVKGVFSLVVIIVIVSPLPTLFNKDWTFEIGDDFSIDSSYVVSVEGDYKENVQQKMADYLRDNDIIASIGVSLEDGKVIRVDIVITCNENLSNQVQMLNAINLISQKFHVSKQIISVSVDK